MVTLSFLEGLAPTTSVRPHDAGGVVLGFEVGNGAVAAHDFPIGKVANTAKLAVLLSVLCQCLT